MPSARRRIMSAVVPPGGGGVAGTAISPIWLPENSVNQRCPSAPVTIPNGVEFDVGNSLKVPSAVRRPILLPAASVNQMAPSGPTVMPWGLLPAVGGVNSVYTPAVVIRPILLVLSFFSTSDSENHSAPSGPTVI